jgi:lactate dehydrogenase-like 2-hydroxyacid dehydrogenase
MITNSHISNFRKGTILINTARAEIVEPTALFHGIETGQIGYAAFDGFYENSDVLFPQAKRLIPNKMMITGHIASLTHEARDGMAKMATQSIVNVLKTGRDKYIVNSL